jgi:hypothetical protein
MSNPESNFGPEENFVHQDELPVVQETPDGPNSAEDRLTTGLQLEEQFALDKPVEDPKTDALIARGNELYDKVLGPPDTRDSDTKTADLIAEGREVQDRVFGPEKSDDAKAAEIREDLKRAYDAIEGEDSSDKA